MHRATRFIAAIVLTVTAVGSVACAQGDVATEERPAEETDGSLE